MSQVPSLTMTATDTLNMTTLATNASQLVANASNIIAASAAMVASSSPQSAPANLLPNGLPGLPCFRDLIAVLFECFSIMTLGYLSGRFKLISSEARDLGAYLTTFALPMIIFLNIAQMEFHTINLSFLFCMLIAKLILFLTVTLLTLVVSYPTNTGYAGALSILATQSNDFALGYPLIKSLYGETMPEMLSYLSLMAPIQLLILNPLGIGLLEYQKFKQRCAEESRLQVDSNIDGLDASIEANKPCKYCTSKSGINRHISKTGNTIGLPNEQGLVRSHGRTSDATNESDGIILDPPEGVFIGQPASGVSAVLGSQQVINRLKGRANVGARSNSVNGHDVSVSNNHRTSCNNVDNRYQNYKRHLLPSISDNAQSLPTRRGVRSLTLSVVPDDHGKLAVDNHDRIGSVKPVTHIGSQIYHGFPNRCYNSDDNANAHETRSSQNNSTSDQIHVSHHLQPQTSQQLAPSSSSSSQQYYEYTNQRDMRSRLSHLQLMSSSAPMLSMLHSPVSVANEDQQCCSCSTNNKTKQPGDRNVDHVDVTLRPCPIDWSFLTAFATNPLIIASVVALVVNLTYGPELPKFVTKVSNTIAASFAAPALFVVGLSMYGKFDLLLKNPNDLLLSSVLVVTKIILLPSLMRTITTIVLPYYVQPEDLPHLVDFSYLYGLLPTAPTVCIIAKQYNVLLNVVSITMILSTFISAPLMLGVAAIINQAIQMSMDVVMDLITQSIRVASLVTLFSSVLTLCALWLAYELYKKTRRLSTSEILCTSIKRLDSRSTRSLLVLLAVVQLILGLSGLMKLVLIGGNDQINDRQSDGSLVINTQPTAQPHTTQLVPPEVTESLDLFEFNETTKPTQIGEANFLGSHNEFDGYICAIQYVILSTSLSLSRLVILCIAATTYVGTFLKQSKAEKLTAPCLKLCIATAVFLIIWYSQDARAAKCLPQAAQTPSSMWSLCMRLSIDSIFLIGAVPIIALLFRIENKRNHILDNDQDLHSLPERCMLASSASLSSDTCSALTTNTNLDLSAPINNGANENVIGNSHELSDPTTSFADLIAKRTLGGSPEIQVDQEYYSVDNNCNITNNMYSASSDAIKEKPIESLSNATGAKHLFTINSDQATNPKSKSNNRTNISERSPPIIHHINQSNVVERRTEMTELTRKSILIVFMLINTLLGVSAMIQSLVQGNPSGTFRQQEILSSTVEFGQGLSLFLLYGVRMFSRKWSW